MTGRVTGNFVPVESMKELEDLFQNAVKLRAAIVFFIRKMPGRLSKVTLSKLLYYSDGHFFQKEGRQITEFEYLHTEYCPTPFFFNELLHVMIAKKEIELDPDVQPQISGGQQIMVLKGLVFNTQSAVPPVLTRQELRTLSSVASTLRDEMNLETRYFPNLYQAYVQTPVYTIIPHVRLPGGKRPHLQWKAWSRRIFRLMWQ